MTSGSWRVMTFAAVAAAILVLPGRFVSLRAAEPATAQAPSLAPYVPTPQDVVERMLALANVGKGDVVIDLGSGDGRMVVTAAKKYGARGIGIDIDPARVAEGKANAAVEAVVARWLGLPGTKVTVAAGHTARVKTLEISGDAGALEALVAACVEALV